MERISNLESRNASNSNDQNLISVPFPNNQNSIESFIEEFNENLNIENNSLDSSQLSHVSQTENSNSNFINFKDRTKLCYVCDEDKIDIFFNCGNGLCLSCIREHIKAQLYKYKVKVLSEKITFVCAGSCKCPVEIQIIENLMDKEIREIYEEVLFKMYMSKSNDIISCPRSSCSFSGFTSKNKALRYYSFRVRIRN
jgi:hypothetical protein